MFICLNSQNIIYELFSVWGVDKVTITKNVLYSYKTAFSEKKFQTLQQFLKEASCEKKSLWSMAKCVSRKPTLELNHQRFAFPWYLSIFTVYAITSTPSYCFDIISLKREAEIFVDVGIAIYCNLYSIWTRTSCLS